MKTATDKATDNNLTVDPTLNPTLNPTIDLSQFDTAEFLPETEALPWIQILNKQARAEKAGLFISQDCCDQCGMDTDALQKAGWTPFTAEFSSGETADGFRTLNPRMIVVRSGDLLMYEETGDLIGRFKKEVYESPKKIILKTPHLIYLVSEAGDLLHTSPIQFTTRGSFGASFGEHLKKFKREVDKATGKKRGPRFYALCVFSFQTRPEEKGQKPNTSWATSVFAHDAVTEDTLGSHFLGTVPDICDKLLETFDQYEEFGTAKTLKQRLLERNKEDEEEGGIPALSSLESRITGTTVWKKYEEALDTRADTLDKVDSMVTWIQAPNQWAQFPHDDDSLLRNLINQRADQRRVVLMGGTPGDDTPDW